MESPDDYTMIKQSENGSWIISDNQKVSWWELSDNENKSDESDESNVTDSSIYMDDDDKFIESNIIRLSPSGQDSLSDKSSLKTVDTIEKKSYICVMILVVIGVMSLAVWNHQTMKEYQANERKVSADHGYVPLPYIVNNTKPISYGRIRSSIYPLSLSKIRRSNNFKRLR